MYTTYNMVKLYHTEIQLQKYNYTIHKYINKYKICILHTPW